MELDETGDLPGWYRRRRIRRACDRRDRATARVAVAREPERLKVRARRRPARLFERPGQPFPRLQPDAGDRAGLEARGLVSTSRSPVARQHSRLSRTESRA